jgi:hypothetical protein
MDSGKGVSSGYPETIHQGHMTWGDGECWEEEDCLDYRVSSSARTRVGSSSVSSASKISSAR